MSRATAPDEIIQELEVDDLVTTTDDTDSFSTLSNCLISDGLPSSWLFMNQLLIEVFEEDPSSKRIPGRLSILRPNIEYVTKVVEDWNYNFLDQVEKNVNSPRELPKRVINVSSPALCLEDFSALPDEQRPTGLYTTISHRWDETRDPLKATVRTLPELKISISTEKLSLGFRDAIELTRRLGIRYIWIDSLCIIQDSSLDWEEESSRMGSYYSSSWLNIAIGLESHLGCFTARELSLEKWYLMCRTLGEGRPTFYFCDSPSYEKATYQRSSILQKRAWTFQEEIQSPRSVTFTKDLIFYHCDTYMVSEQGTQTIFSKYYNSNGALLTKEDVHAGRWEKMVVAYFERDLTKYEDRLPALSGIAHIYQSVWNDVFQK